MAEGQSQVPGKDQDYEAPAITTLGTVDELTAGDDEGGSPPGTTHHDDD
jgi:hypothetical protein